MTTAEEAFVNLSDYDKEELLNYHRGMLLIRRFEEKVNEMYVKAKIGGYCHLNNGEEACIVGAYSVLGQEDYIFTSYRDHGHALARAVPAKEVMAELFGKVTGCSRGRGGSMHLFDPDRRFMGGHAIVGGHLPLAVGVAMAIKYREGKEIVLCSLGEGATNIGAFNESLNLAQLWRLPVVFLCINNQYEMGTPISKTSAQKDLYRKAIEFDMASAQVDGTDVLAVRGAVLAGLNRAREESLPTFVEAICYRLKGHSVIDPGRYRAKEEIERWTLKDPVILFQQRLMDNGMLAEEDHRRMDEDIIKEVQEAVEFAEESPFPDQRGLFDFLYAESQEE